MLRLMALLQSCQRFLIRQGFSPIQRLLLLVGGGLCVVWLSYWCLSRGLDWKTVYSDAGPALSNVSPDQWKRQARLDYLANYMHVTFHLVSNLVGQGHQHRARISLHNIGSETITGWDWAMNFHSRRRIEGRRLEKRQYIEIADLQLKLWHINGDLFQLSPTEKFRELRPGEKLEVMYIGQAWIVARTDASPNWFVSAPGLQPKLLKSTAGESLSFVKPFNTEAQWKRSAHDLWNPFTPESRYQEYDVQDMGTAPSLIVPTPFHVSYEHSKSVTIDEKWVIVVQKGAEAEAKYLSGKLGLPIKESIPQDHYILLNLGDVSLTEDQQKNAEEAYTLNSFGGSHEHILIGATTSHGIFYGIQTLLNMMDMETRAVLHANVQDVPRYPYRGLMLDVARNFQPKSAVMKVIEIMATYKMNQLHLHLADDEGWRLQIPGLEELTQVGVRKGFDLLELSGLLPFLGSVIHADPDPQSAAGSGFYSVQDYSDILKHAAKHYVTIIPEFDMPGHAHAAIKSMEARARRLSKENNVKAAEEYLLSDPQDKSKYESVQFFNDDAMNPCLESTYLFVEHVMEQVVKMHKAIQPLDTFHFGGDEVPGSAFLDSPACEHFYEREGGRRGHDALKAYFVERVSGLAAKQGLKLQGWEDAFYVNDDPHLKLYSPSNVVNAWKNVWEKGNGHRAYQLANAGFKVVLTHATNLYLDHPQEPDPEERGLYWATRYTDMIHIFGYSPFNIYTNIQTDLWGKALNAEVICHEHKCPVLEKSENIIGLEAPLWGETVRTPEQLEFMVFPRLLAVAERAWHQSKWETQTDVHTRQRLKQEDWAQFANTLGYRELRRLERLGVAYRLPVPGAQKDTGHLVVNSMFPGVPVQYSIDQGRTWQDWKSDNDMTLPSTILLSTRSFDGKRQSRSIEVNS